MEKKTNIHKGINIIEVGDCKVLEIDRSAKLCKVVIKNRDKELELTYTSKGCEIEIIDLKLKCMAN